MQEDLPGFVRFVVHFMIQMSKVCAFLLFGNVESVLCCSRLVVLNLILYFGYMIISDIYKCIVSFLFLNCFVIKHLNLKMAFVLIIGE